MTRCEAIRNIKRDDIYGFMLCCIILGITFGFAYIAFTNLPNLTFHNPTMTYVNGYTTYIEQSSCQVGMIIENCYYYHLNYTLNGKVITYNDGLKYDWVGNLDAGDTICVQLADGHYWDFTVGDCK